MKLGKLNAAIRDEKYVTVPIHFPNGEQRSVRVQKTDLIANLQDAYDKERAVETDLELIDGEIRGLVAADRVARAEAINSDDLLGDSVPSEPLYELIGNTTPDIPVDDLLS